MPDIHLKIAGDPGFEVNKIELQNELEILLGQIEMILFTRKNVVLGDPGFGLDLEAMLYSLNLNQGMIQTIILDQIQSYCPLASKYRVVVNVKFFRGNVRDIGVIDVVVNDTATTSLIVT